MWFKILNKLFIAFLLIISTVLIFTAMGWVRLLVVKTGSMQPNIPTNSLVAVIPNKSIFNQEKIYKTGDVVTFKAPQVKELITHRIVRVEIKNGQTFYKTKGDANTSNDVDLRSQGQVFGKVGFSLAGFGFFANFLNSFLGLFILVIIPSTFIILHEVLVIQEELKRVSEANCLKVSKKTLVGPIVILLFLVLAAPVYALFSSIVLLDSNSLSTKESFFANHVVINEVYYQVDSRHGKDSPIDRRASSSCSSENNSADVNNNVNVNGNTGGNSFGGNTRSTTSINIGSTSASININNNVNHNTNNCSSQNNEWVELYNPTGVDINLKNWSFTDNSGKLTKIQGNKIIKSHQFALVSKDSSTWSFWTINPTLLKIELGKEIGDGLGNSGDKLILKNSLGQAIDSLSYGSDAYVFNPSVALVTLGNSFERSAPGLDNETAVNFLERYPPTPGY